MATAQRARAATEAVTDHDDAPSFRSIEDLQAAGINVCLSSILYLYLSV